MDSEMEQQLKATLEHMLLTDPEVRRIALRHFMEGGKTMTDAELDAAAHELGLDGNHTH